MQQKIILRNYSLEKNFFIILGIYLLTHLIFRLIISNSLEIDEAEMVLWFQSPFHLGYNSQPPLYYWIQMLFFYLFGLNIFSLSLLKNFLFFLIYLFLYKSAKEILKHSWYSIFSVVSLFLVYNFSWILYKDATHSILVLVICAITLYLFIKLLTYGSFKYYFLFGIFMGLGFLSKYNYFLFILSLIFSGLTIKDYRRYILDKKMLISLFLAFIIILPHLFWCIDNFGKLMVDKEKLNMANSGNLIFILKGILAFLKKSLIFLFPLFFIYFLIFREGFRKKEFSFQENKIITLFKRFFLIFILITTSLIIFFKITDIQVRWILPFLFLFPLYFFIHLKNIPLNPLKIKIFLILVLIFASLVLFSLPGRVFFASLRHKYSRLNYPYKELSEIIKKNYFKKGLILAQNYIIGADLKLNFKDSLVISPDEKINFPLPKEKKPVLIVWEDKDSQNVCGSLGRILDKLKLDYTNLSPFTLEALYKYSVNRYYKIKLLVVN